MADSTKMDEVEAVVHAARRLLLACAGPVQIHGTSESYQMMMPHPTIVDDLRVAIAELDRIRGKG